MADVLPITDSNRLGFLSSHVKMSSNLRCVDLYLANKGQFLISFKNLISLNG